MAHLVSHRSADEHSRAGSRFGCAPGTSTRPIAVIPVDALLTGIGLALTVLLAVLALRDGATLRQGRCLAALAVSVSAQVLATSPLGAMLPGPLFVTLRAIGAPNVGLLWWFCLALLRDGFRPGRTAWAGLAALSFAPAAYLLSDAGLRVPHLAEVAALGSVPPLVMVLHVLGVAIGERGGDLLEPRRRARVWLVFALLFALVVSLATEELDDQQLAVILRNALVLVPMSGALLLWLVRLQAGRLEFIPIPVGRPSPGPGIDPHDIALFRRLQQALTVDACYLRPDLTIDGLADHLRTPVHQLRALINTGLGHRNFPALMNEHRVAHARRLLSDPERARDTVLSVALQSGFASLATFNRVFRDLEGRTPTAYRAESLAAQLPDLPSEPRIS